MWRRISQIFLSLILCLLPLISQSVRAEVTGLSPQVVINELQFNGHGTGTTGQEFIELKNISDSAVDVSDWKLQYISSTGNLTTAKYFVTFPASTIIYPGGLLLVTPDTYLTEASPKISYTITSSFAGLAASGGTVALVNTVAVVIDLVGWGTKATTLCETELATLPPDGSSIQRVLLNNVAVDTNNNKNDFEITIVPTPETVNNAPIPDPPADPDPVIVPDPVITPEPTPDPIPDPITTLPDQNPVVPPEQQPTPSTEQPILLNELFIDPASPLTDANDEWVEIYNPNETSQDLAGYTIYAGDTFAYHHTFGIGSSISAHGFMVITSAGTSIALANGGGAVKITGPSGQTYDTVTYDTAKTGESWAKDSNSQWVWTTTATQDTQNVITIPTIAEKIVSTAAATTKKASTKQPTATIAKVTTPKVATTKATKVKGATTVNDPALVPAPSPLPIWLLATLGTLAVLYSTYEYRFDIANKIYQFRTNRTTRSGNGRSS